jgi:hypothetical protein
MNATKFVKLKRNFPKFRPTEKEYFEVDKLPNLKSFSNKFEAKRFRKIYKIYSRE